MSLKEMQENQELLQIHKMLEIAKQTMEDHINYMSNLYITIQEHRRYDECFCKEDKEELLADYAETCNKYVTLHENTERIKAERAEEQARHEAQRDADLEANGGSFK